jgi:uroporphyrin-III C-methyltransferase/precorrin-2 dehydrogenase/sirohydrochlorin ferrochelatase/uroporphyrin-III C-methyltransferase
VVILMGVSTLSESAANLATQGRGAECPVAVIEDGFGEQERVTIATLGTIAAIAEEQGIKAPAVVVVGDVVGLARAGADRNTEGNK